MSRTPPPPADPVERLQFVGTAMYGDDWQTALAQALGVARTTVVRWAGGGTKMPPDLDARLAEAVTKRADEIVEQSHALKVLASRLELLVKKGA